MSEQKKKVGGNFKPQSAITIGRNKRLKAERHAKRMQRQMKTHKVPHHDGALEVLGLAVPRGTARALRRKPLQVMYAKRLAKQAGAAALA